MIRRGYEQPVLRPIVNLLEQHGNEALQLADFRVVVPSLCDGIKLIKEETPS